MINGAIGIALDVNHLTVFDVHIQTTANCTIGTDTVKKLGIPDTRSLLATLDTKWLDPGTHLHNL
jgi:hypothetical protein